MSDEIRTLDEDTVEVAGLTRESMVRMYATNGRNGAANHYLSPAQARQLAAALLRAADEAEGAHPGEDVFSARQHVRDTWVAGNGPEAFSSALDVLESAVRRDERDRT